MAISLYLNMEGISAKKDLARLTRETTEIVGGCFVAANETLLVANE